MSQRSKIAALGISASGLLLTALGAWAIAQEAAVFMIHGSTALKTIVMRSDGDPIGMGIITRSELLATCETTLRSRDSFELKLMPEVSFDGLVERCRTIAESVAVGSPNFSLALAVAADAASKQEDWTSMNRFLIASQRSGANEQRIGHYRFRIADANLQHLMPTARPSYDADLRLQIVSSEGLAQVAQRYMNDEAFRDRVAKVLRQMNDGDQHRFLQTLRSMLPTTVQ